MSKPRIADLFCCSGGAGRGLASAGFDVVGVDIRHRPRYPFEFVRSDALTFDLAGFDAVWASPPCQGHSTATPERYRGGHPDLIPAMRSRLEAWGGPWIIENVVGAHKSLRSPVLLCGTMFGLRVLRHRLFESSVMLLAPEHQLHRGTVEAGDFLSPVGHGVGSRVEKSRIKKGMPARIPGERLVANWKAAMGLTGAKMTSWEVAQAIPPAYAEYLGKFLLQAVNCDINTRRRGSRFRPSAPGMQVSEEDMPF